MEIIFLIPTSWVFIIILFDYYGYALAGASFFLFFLGCEWTNSVEEVEVEANLSNEHELHVLQQNNNKRPFCFDTSLCVLISHRATKMQQYPTMEAALALNRSLV